MRNIFLLLVVLTPFSVHATENVTKFEGIQQACVQVGKITFGPGGRWASCYVTHGRWVATLDFLDVYQVQYCLSNKSKRCDKRALVIFANRAYTPDAKVLMVRIDDGAAQYDDPLVVDSDNESIMSISVHDPAGAMTKYYYLWRTDHWVEMNAKGWLRGLAARIPKGVSVRQTAWPDLETMSAQVSLFRTGDADCCPTGGMAKVDLELAKAEFAVKQVKVSSMSK